MSNKGFVNKALVKTLLTKNKRYAAAVPCIYHGIKVKYFHTRDEAEEWIKTKK